jgi:hypothetical protein
MKKMMEYIPFIRPPSNQFTSKTDSSFSLTSVVKTEMAKKSILPGKKTGGYFLKLSAEKCVTFRS